MPFYPALLLLSEREKKFWNTFWRFSYVQQSRNISSDLFLVLHIFFINVESVPCILRSSMSTLISSFRYHQNSVWNFFYLVRIETSNTVDIYFWSGYKSFPSNCYRIFLSFIDWCSEENFISIVGNFSS